MGEPLRPPGAIRTSYDGEEEHRPKLATEVPALFLQFDKQSVDIGEESLSCSNLPLRDKVDKGSPIVAETEVPGDLSNIERVHVHESMLTLGRGSSQLSHAQPCQPPPCRGRCVVGFQRRGMGVFGMVGRARTVSVGEIGGGLGAIRAWRA